MLQQSVEQRTGLAVDEQQLANFASKNQQATQIDKKQTGTLEFLQQKSQTEQPTEQATERASGPHPPPAPAALPGRQESTPQSRLAGLLEDNPQLETNQDFINYCYRHGNNSWGGASKVADRYGQDLNDLVRDRQGSIRSAAMERSGGDQPAASDRPDNPTPATRTAPTAPVTNRNASGAELETFPIAGGRYNIGYDRDWNNFDATSATHNSDFSTSPTSRNHPTGHQGVDIFAPRGQPVVSPVTGVVEKVGHTGAGGNCVTIRRGDERFYLAHLDSMQNLRPGQSISAGDAIGTVGNTGNARGTAPHLHFSIYRGAGGYASNPINPFPHLMAAR